MTTEERILAYLDGSLDEHESAELMHQLSVSPEKRVILEQHIKLSELTRVAQRPFEVPAELEETLAKRLPAVVGTSAVSSMRGGSAPSSLLLLLRQYPMRFALGGLLTLLAGGAIYWYGANGTMPSADTRSANTEQLTANTSTSEHSASTGAATGGATSSVPATTGSHQAAAPSDIDAENVSTQRMHGQAASRTASRRSSHHDLSRTNEFSISLLHRESQRTTTLSTVSPVHADNTPGDISKERSPISIGVRAHDAGAPLVTATDVRAMGSDNVSAIIGSDSRGKFRLSDPQAHDGGRRSDWAIRASVGYGSTFLYVPTGSNAYASRNDGNLLVGIDYSLSERWAVGVEGGWTSNQVLSPSSTIITDGSISRVVTHATSTTSSPLFTRVALRYTVNPFDPVRVELGGGGGRVFGSAGGWMTHAQAGIGFNPGSDALELQVSMLYSGVWSSNSAAISSTTTNTSDPIEYSTVNMPSTSIYTPAITLRVGAQYRLP